MLRTKCVQSQGPQNSPVPGAKAHIHATEIKSPKCVEQHLKGEGWQLVRVGREGRGRRGKGVVAVVTQLRVSGGEG